MATPPLIELHGVTKYFGSTCALHNINLTIANGEFLTLLGPFGLWKILGNAENRQLSCGGYRTVYRRRGWVLG